MMNVRIEKLEKNQTETAIQLFRLFQMDDGVENPDEVSDNYLKNLLARTDFHVLAAFDGENLIGGLTAYELAKYKTEVREMFLYELVVDKNYRRKQAASRLIDFLKNICSEKEISEIFLLTENSNFAARNLYLKTDGVPVETVLFKYELSKEDE